MFLPGYDVHAIILHVYIYANAHGTLFAGCFSYHGSVLVAATCVDEQHADVVSLERRENP